VFAFPFAREARGPWAPLLEALEQRLDPSVLLLDQLP
jgi:hypothetical protein